MTLLDCDSALAAHGRPQTRHMIDVSALSVERGTARLIEHAAQMGASDLFFVANEGHMAVQVRHLGMMRLISTLTLEEGRKYLSHIRASAHMDITERRRPADGRWIFRPESGEDIDLRINTMPTLHGEDVALRLIRRDTGLLSLDNLGMTAQQLQNYGSMLESPSGLILVCGPTGSGKTTTLYASLAKLNDGRRKIHTIEDPIEHAIDGLRQSQVNPAVDVGFSELLRSVLRQAPDVIMLGEIRDPQTAQIAVHAANAGVMVLATVHAPSAAGAIQSMRALGVNSHFLATAFRGAIAQRLVRTLCPDCSISFDLTEAPHTFDDVRPWLEPGKGNRLFASQGCPACAMTGYAARTGVFEVMCASRAIRNLISDSRPTREVRAKAIEEKMLEFRQAALLKVARGQTSTEEVFRVIPTEHLMLDD